jgi:hypothetical protein
MKWSPLTSKDGVFAALLPESKRLTGKDHLIAGVPKIAFRAGDARGKCEFNRPSAALYTSVWQMLADVLISTSANAAISLI